MESVVLRYMSGVRSCIKEEVMQIIANICHKLSTPPTPVHRKLQHVEIDKVFSV